MTGRVSRRTFLNGVGVTLAVAPLRNAPEGDAVTVAPGAIMRAAGRDPEHASCTK
jgi:hypothetical protein